MSVRVSSKEIKISLKVKNSGKYDGDEVVMLFIRDEISSIARPLKELKRFQRITLKTGEEKEVKFILSEKDLSFLDEEMKMKFEPGAFIATVGDLSKHFEIKNRNSKSGLLSLQ